MQEKDSPAPEEDDEATTTTTRAEGGATDSRAEGCSLCMCVCAGGETICEEGSWSVYWLAQPLDG